MVPFPWIDPVVAIVLALIDRGRQRPGFRPGWRADAVRTPPRAVLAPVYIGLPLGALVGIAAVGGREAVLILIGDRGRQRHGAVLCGPGVRAPPAGAAAQPEEDGRRRYRRVRPRAGRSWCLRARSWLPGIIADPAARCVGVLLVAAGMTGDLFESMLKRAADVKDSSDADSRARRGARPHRRAAVCGADFLFLHSVAWRGPTPCDPLRRIE